MSQKHVNLLRDIFQDPVNTKLSFREVESLLKHLGAQMESVAGARMRVKLNEAEGVLHRPHHGGNTMDRHSVQSLRDLLTRGGATPAQYEARRPD
ncbi:MAG: type II toxin-antitoxin system HicA family toxin [Pseudomonadota bacterium]|nr:type II toxin-antitoxin system HicA family toxin [Burkholderiaceae bacterium]MDQ3188974.1 type II toxin-antitoxin system HicA family toxin [Pseudomonadota bacterium]